MYGRDHLPPRPRRVLIAEDETSLSNLLVQAFTEAGYGTSVAVNGIDCMNKLAGFRPDVVVMDIMMPKLDGIDATRLIRRNPAFARTVIVALTARDDTATRSEMMAAGADRFLGKPFAVSHLLEEVAGLLAARGEADNRKDVER